MSAAMVFLTASRCCRKDAEGTRPGRAMSSSPSRRACHQFGSCNVKHVARIKESTCFSTTWHGIWKTRVFYHVSTYLLIDNVEYVALDKTDAQLSARQVRIVLGVIVDVSFNVHHWLRSSIFEGRQMVARGYDQHR